MKDDDRAGFFHRRSRSGRTVGAAFGIFLLPAAVFLLIWNEGHAVDTARALAEGGGVVREASVDRVDPALDGKLVHVAGRLSVPGALADPDLPAMQAPPGTVRLKRAVQTYQWQEVSSRGGSYSYRQLWSDQVIASSGFHQPGGPSNPVPRFRAMDIVVPEASLGVYRVTEPLLRTLGGGRAMALPDDAADPPGTRRDGGGIYVGRNPDAPEIGDQRLAWEVLQATEVSVVAQQHGAGFVPYVAASGSRIHLIEPGLLTAAAMIAGAEDANEAATWVWRVLGAGLLFLAFFLILRARPYALAGSAVHPLVQLAAGVEPASAGAALAAVVAPTVIAAAWLAHRPAVGIGLLALGLAAGWLWIRHARRPDPARRRP